MMLEQSLISPNFLGKESFRWFIGRVTDYKQTDKNGYKAKVRIIGYHPDSKNVIDDDELPWAHVLVPLGSGSGTGGTGVSFNARGSETVIGFFMDGDNGQQPVIIGSLFSGYDIVNYNSFDEGTNGFNGYKPRKKPLSSLTRSSKTGKLPTGKDGNPTTNGIVNTEAKVGMTTSSDTSQGTREAEVKGEVILIPSTCESSNTAYSRVVQALRKFIKALNTINQVSGLINSITNSVANITGLIQSVASTLSDLFGSVIKKVRDLIVGKIYKALEGFLNSILPKDIKIFKQLATDKIVDTIWCAFSKIIKGLAEFFVSFLTQLVDKVISIPLCAVESLVGSVLSTISNLISGAIGPALEELSSLIGGVIGSISSLIGQALGIANSALNFLSCESSECRQQFDYEMNKGYIPSNAVENINNILNYPNQSIQDGGFAAEQWLGLNGYVGSDIPFEIPIGGCDVTSIECGLPVVSFFGGGGTGAAGLAVVDTLGQVIGVNLTDFGSGYNEAPYVSIDDSCDNGSGARATAIITDGKVTSVIIDNPGYGYFNSSTYTGITTDPCFAPLIDSSGSEVVGFVMGIDVVRPGIGYTFTDRIVDEVCPSNDMEIYPIVDSLGRITGTNIVNPGSSIRVLPELEINSEDGEGAIIKPILAFKPVTDISIESNPLKVKKVVLCAENHDI